MGQSLASFVAIVGLEKYCVFLIFSQEKHLHFQEKSQEKSGKNVRQNAYEPWHVTVLCVALFHVIVVSVAVFPVAVCLLPKAHSTCYGLETISFMGCGV